MTAFKLDDRLAADSTYLGLLRLCEVRLSNDANYPWLILIPQRDAIREIHELTEDDQEMLTREVVWVSRRLEALTGATKMNVAALGNMVPQLHVHIVARFEEDAAWPGAIWGAADARPYGADELATRIKNVQDALQLTA